MHTPFFMTLLLIQKIVILVHNAWKWFSVNSIVITGSNIEFFNTIYLQYRAQCLAQSLVLYSIGMSLHQSAGVRAKHLLAKWLLCPQRRQRSNFSMMSFLAEIISSCDNRPLEVYLQPLTLSIPLWYILVSTSFLSHDSKSVTEPFVNVISCVRTTGRFSYLCCCMRVGTFSDFPT